MQQTRTIKFGTTSGDAGSNGVVYSAATTWGDLLDENTQLDALNLTPGFAPLIKLSGGQNYKPTGRDFSLPTGDFSVYFTPDKNNSGI